MRARAMDRLTAITAFLAVADARGFAAAARRLRASPSSVTRLILGLEEHLGVQLLARTTRSVALTEAGARFLERARRIVSDLDEAEELARQERATPSGRLVVSAPVMFGRMHVAIAMGEYLARYPEATGELQLGDRAVNLVEEGVDLAVRIGELADSALVVRRVGATRRVLVGSPKYLRSAPALRSPSDLPRHQTVAFTALAPTDEWTFRSRDEEVRVALRPRYVTNSADAAISFAERGGGLTLALSYQVADALQRGTLELVLPKHEPPPLPIQLAFPSARLLSAKVRAFIELVTTSYRWDFTEV